MCKDVYRGAEMEKDLLKKLWNDLVGRSAHAYCSYVGKMKSEHCLGEVAKMMCGSFSSSAECMSQRIITATTSRVHSVSVSNFLRQRIHK
jgi:chemotaxis protein CheY-P-specific phosphatase CheC